MQCQCLSIGADEGFKNSILLDFTLIPNATSLSLNLFFFLSLPLFVPFHSYFYDVQHSAVLPSASRLTAKAKLFGLCSCTTALSLWQRDSNKDRLSSASWHCYLVIKCTLEVWGAFLNHEKKNMHPNVHLTVFTLTSCFLDFFLVKFYTAERMRMVFLSWKEKKAKTKTKTPSSLPF